MASLARFYFGNFCHAGIFWKLPHSLNSSQKKNWPFFINLDLILTLGWRSTRKNVFLSTRLAFSLQTLINFEVETWTEVALNFCVWKRGAIFAPKIRLLPRAFFVSKTRGQRSMWLCSQNYRPKTEKCWPSFREFLRQEGGRRVCEVRLEHF